MSSRPRQFVSAYDTRGLPDAVRAVALACRPEDPIGLTQAQFDEGRARVPEHARAPTARQICSRLGMSWPVLLQALFEPGRDQARSLGRRQGEAPDHELTTERAANALRVVAARRGVTTLRPHEYEQTRNELLDRVKRKYRHGTSLDLPTVGQIERVAGGWGGALLAAGLEVRRPATARAHSSVVTYYEAIRRYLETQGAMPTGKRLAAFARAQGFPLPRTPPEKHPGAVLAVHDEFVGQGRWAPARSPKPGQHPPYDYESVSTRKLGERRMKKRRTKDECIEGIVAYLDQLPPHENAGQKRYGAWCTGTGHPAPSKFSEYGGWTKLLAEARARRREAS